MTTRIFVAVCIAAASATALGAASQQPAAPEIAVKISTPIYRTNGNVDGGSGTWKLSLGQPVVAYPNGGSTFCGPADAAGWRVEITPVSVSTGTVMDVAWQRVSVAAADAGQQVLIERQRLAVIEGRASGSARDLNDLLLARQQIGVLEGHLSGLLKGASHGVTRVTLRPGDRVVLDYISTSVRTISPNMATEVAYVTGRPACDVVGMGLEIGIEAPPKAPTIVESELWLVHTRPDKTEETQHQTLRVRAGDSAMYWFDDVMIPIVVTSFAGSKFPGIQPQSMASEAAIKVSGRLEPVDAGDDKIHMKLTIARTGLGHVAAQHTGSVSPTALTIGPPAGSTTYDLVAEPGEVLSFQLPAVAPQAPRVTGGSAEGFAIRMRARFLK